MCNAPLLCNHIYKTQRNGIFPLSLSASLVSGILQTFLFIQILHLLSSPDGLLEASGRVSNKPLSSLLTQEKNDSRKSTVTKGFV